MRAKIPPPPPSLSAATHRKKSSAEGDGDSPRVRKGNKEKGSNEKSNPKSSNGRTTRAVAPLQKAGAGSSTSKHTSSAEAAAASPVAPAVDLLDFPAEPDPPQAPPKASPPAIRAASAPPVPDHTSDFQDFQSASSTPLQGASVPVAAASWHGGGASIVPPAAPTQQQAPVGGMQQPVAQYPQQHGQQQGVQQPQGIQQAPAAGAGNGKVSDCLSRVLLQQYQFLNLFCAVRGRTAGIQSLATNVSRDSCILTQFRFFILTVESPHVTAGILFPPPATGLCRCHLVYVQQPWSRPGS